MKILTVVEFGPGIKLQRRSAFQAAMSERGFVRLPGVSSTWVADGIFASLDLAREAVAEAAAASDAAVHKAYLVEYGAFVVFPGEAKPMRAFRRSDPR